MIQCSYCSDSTTELAFECNYCGSTYCESHRLPESHDCNNISQARPPTSTPHEPDAFTDLSRGATSVDDIDLKRLRERAQQENKPYDVVKVEKTVGSTIKPDYESSPDVAIDGSVKGQQEKK